MKAIESIRNPQIQALRRLDTPAERRKTGLFLAEGVKLTREALALGLARVLVVEKEAAAQYAPEIAACEAAGAECLIVPQAVLDAICTTRTPQALLCAAAIPPQPEALTGTLLLALDGVQDPGNLGTMLRTADAAGFDGALLGPGCADPYGTKALRATMGSLFRVPIRQTASLAEELQALREAGYAVLSSELGGESFYAGCPAGNAVLVIGSEGHGVSPAVSAAATHRLRLPMRGGAESLNAAVAAGIMMYELSRRTKGE